MTQESAMVVFVGIFFYVIVILDAGILIYGLWNLTWRPAASEWEREPSAGWLALFVGLVVLLFLWFITLPHAVAPAVKATGAF